MNTCEKIQKLISDYMDGLLSEEEKAGFVSHMENCAHCRNDVALAQEIREGLSQLSDVPAPASLHSGIMEHIAVHTRKNRQPFYLRHKIYAPAVAAIVLAVLFRTSAVNLYSVIHNTPEEPSFSTIQIVQNPPEFPAVMAPDEQQTAYEEESGTSDGATASNDSAATNTNSSASGKRTQSGGTSSGTVTKPVTPPVVTPAPPSSGGESAEKPTPTPDNTGSEQVVYNAYAQNPDSYDKHALRVKKSAVTGTAFIKVGAVSSDYYEQIKESLDEGVYKEEFVSSETKDPVGDLYFVVVQ